MCTFPELLSRILSPPSGFHLLLIPTFCLRLILTLFWTWPFDLWLAHSSSEELKISSPYRAPGTVRARPFRETGWRRRSWGQQCREQEQEFSAGDPDFLYRQGRTRICLHSLWGDWKIQWPVEPCQGIHQQCKCHSVVCQNKKLICQPVIV